MLNLNIVGITQRLPAAQAHRAKDWAERIGDLLLDGVDPVAAAAHAAVAAILVSTLANAGTPDAARCSRPGFCPTAEPFPHETSITN